MGERRTDLPSGTVTFLFTDIEGSTRRAAEVGDEGWAALLAVHNRMLRAAMRAHGGVEINTEGDAFFFAFDRATDAVAGALEGQRALQAHSWPDRQRVEVRMGLHTGEALVREGDYVGHHVHRASRICDAAHGGQILLSQITADLVGDGLPRTVTLRDLGAHRLKDLAGPQHLFELRAPPLARDFPPLRTLEGYANNLPVQRSTFVGRVEEIARVSALLDAHALVSLTGVGGCGKTRLALQVAAGELDRRPDGVFFVDLAALSDPDLVARAVADAMGLTFGGGLTGASGSSSADLVVGALARRRCLLILDNCEHLLDACASLADRILATCPGVRVLTTSRESLGVEGEQVHRVPSLSLPRSREGMRSEAVELFMDRARSAGSDVEATPEHVASVEQICHRLDGIPLAIEFAAARAAHLTPQAIASRLDDRFRLLTGGRRRVQRQQTLEAALDWSHDLLDPAQQTLLRRLTVFAGSFALPMAEEICSEDGIERSAMLDLLASLVDKSLVMTESVEGEPRYRLLETVRSYAEAKLDAAGEAERFRSRHRDAYLGWLESSSWEELFFDTGRIAAVTREHSNLGAALTWSHSQDRRDLVGRLAARAFVLWSPGGGRGEEGHRWLSWALEEPEELDRDVQAACLVTLAAASATVGNPDVEVHAARAIALGRAAVGSLIVSALGWQTVGASIRAIIDDSPAVAREARALADAQMRAAAELGGLWPNLARMNHGDTAVILGDLAAAERSYAATDPDTWGMTHFLREYLSAALTVCRTLLGDPSGALAAARPVLHAHAPRTARAYLPNHLAAALAEVHLGATASAAAHLATGLRIAEAEGILLDGNECLLYAGALACEWGEHRIASRLLAAAVSVGHARHASVTFQKPTSFAVYRHYRPLLRHALGQEEARRCRDEGRAMTLDAALAEAFEVAELLQKVAVQPIGRTEAGELRVPRPAARPHVT